MLTMGILPTSLLTTITAVLAIGLVAVYLYFKRKYQTWAKRNIKFIEPSFPFGNFQGIGRTRNFGRVIRDVYENSKSEKIIGYWMFSKPSVLVRDPDLIKAILVKDFSSFHDRGFQLDTKREPLVNHLFVMNGQEWRNLRIKLTPTFTSGKMKMMFQTMADVGEELKKTLSKAADKGEVVEVKGYLARYTSDVIGSVAFGLNINSLENPDNEFWKITKELQKPDLYTRLVGLVAFAIPQLASALKLRLMPRHITEFFLGAVRDTMQTREEKNIKRNDFMQLLIQLKNKGYVEDADADKTSNAVIDQQKFTVEQAAAQAFIFFFAGFETSSGTMQFALYELALQPEIQKQLQDEIDKVLTKHNGKLTYDGVQEMGYLDQVVSETLRKYPVADIIMRECNKEYQVPGMDAVLQKGDALTISLSGIHHDEQYYPNPEKFDPERFTAEAKEARNPYTYIPFGDGPRSCIGNRFALMQTKTGLAVLLSNFTVEVCEKTPIPLVLDPEGDFISPLGGMHLRLRHRNK